MRRSSKRHSRRLSGTPKGEVDDVPCTHCGITYWCDGDEMLLCDGPGCTGAYHLRCTRPILASMPTTPTWLCPSCEVKHSDSSRTAKKQNDDDMDVACEKCQLRWWWEGNEIILCARYDSHGCHAGCHLKCHRPKLTTIPEGEWLCAKHAPEVRTELGVGRAGPELRPRVPEERCAVPSRAWLKGHCEDAGQPLWDVGYMNECPVCGQWFSHKGYIEHIKYNTPIQPTDGNRLPNREMSNSLVEWEPGYPGYPGLPKHAFLRINAGSCRQLRSTPPCQARSMLRQHGVWFNSQIFRGRLGPLLDLAKHREALLEKENVSMYQYDYYADGLTRASDVIDADGVDYREHLNTLREHVSFVVREIFPELSVTYQEGHDKVRFFNGSYHTPLHADHTLQHRLVGYDTTDCTLLTVWVALSRTKKARDALCFYLPGGDSTCLQEGTVACMVDVEPGACAMFLETTPHFCPKEQCWRKYPKGFRASVDMRFVISPAGKPKHLGSELKEELASDSPAIRPSARLG
ncbi:hypothetical protein FOL46_004591 [Perkinsus olseni]|uniref:PHD-type domain-containing protein n=1 Tax=Perkinsus olseni TaxID=32597 RepID=A0A7J6MSM3_PEROL|nr:hypothetical protein FOL46_004591 [Perkinsus olseni]